MRNLEHFVNLILISTGPPVPAWGEWTSWSACSVSCTTQVGGTSRTRICIGGTTCIGEGYQARTCSGTVICGKVTCLTNKPVADWLKMSPRDITTLNL